MQTRVVHGVLTKAFWYFAGNGSSRLLTLVVLILAGRALGPDDFGLLAALLGFSLFLTSLAELGLTTWATRRIAADRELERPTLDAVLSLAAITTAATLLLSGAVLAVISTALLVPMLLILWFGCCTLIGNSVNSSLVAREQPRVVALISLIEKGLLLGLVLAFMLVSSLTLWAIGIAYAAAGTVRVITVIALVHRLADWTPQPVGLATLRTTVSESWPFGLTQAIYSMGGRLDVLFVALISATTAGLFNAAFRLIEASFLITQSLTLAVLPMAVRARKAGQQEFRRISYLMLLMAAVISLPITLVFMLGSNLFIEIIYGSEFSGAATVLAISALCLPFSFVNTTAIALLNAAGLEKRILPLALAGQTVRLATVVALASLVGTTGPAIGVVLGGAVAFAGYAFVLHSALKADPAASVSDRRLGLSEAS